MDKVKSVTKSGWHPSGKDGKKESWRGDFKGINQVAGWVGKGKNPSSEASEHQSRPLASLKNPDVFGPPPKNVNYHGGAAVADTVSPDRVGYSAFADDAGIRAREEEEQRELQAAEEAVTRKGPPVPYRMDTTGLTTNDLPKPPVRRLGNGTLPSSPLANPTTKPKPKPSLPPRLPPRQTLVPVAQEDPSPPPPYSASPQQTTTPTTSNSAINQTALRRLGSAGIRVPSLGIGSDPQQPNPHQPPNEPSPPPPNPLSNLSKLTQPSPNSPPQGTTPAQKRAALQTLTSFHQDPSSITLASAQSTASTANNFRARHGEQVADGWKRGTALNRKYGLVDRFNAHAAETAGEGAEESAETAGEKRKPPPPPPPPAPGFKTAGSSGSAPPPVPLASKPR